MSEKIDPSVVSALLAIVGDEGRKQMELNAWNHRDTDIAYEGKKITLPGDPGPMPLEAAINTLQQKLEDENQIMNVSQVITGYPFDAAVAFVKAMERTYGWASPVPTPGFFGSTPPQLLTVRTGPEFSDTMQVPLGSFKVPGVEKPITTGIGPHGFGVSGKCRKKEKRVIMDLCALAQKIMATESIYRGKAIRLTVSEDGDLDRTLEPTFLATKHVKPDELIMSKTVGDLINVSVFTPIKHTAQCEKDGIPLRRGILLEGPFGTGKSMTASVTSKVCVDNGWTFIMLDKVQGLKEALLFARQYQPAVVFAEDIDRITEARDEKANDLLNTIDGVLNKDAKVITVLTTNFVERIDRAMMRPGRLDAVITVSPPDAEAAEKLVRLYARGRLPADESLSAVGKALDGQIPATIREVVERSKLAMIANGHTHLTQDDLLLAAEGMKRHLELLNRDTGPRESNGDILARTLANAVGGIDTSKIDAIYGVLGDTHDLVHHTARKVNELEDTLQELGEQKPPAITPEQAKLLNDTHTKVKKIEKVVTG